jgi:hypothetical protein
MKSTWFFLLVILIKLMFFIGFQFEYLIKMDKKTKRVNKDGQDLVKLIILIPHLIKTNYIFKEMLNLLLLHGKMISAWIIIFIQ